MQVRFLLSPTEVEQALCRAKLIQEVAASGLPDEVLGQHIKAFVTPREGLCVDAQQLIQACFEQMTRHLAPKSIEFVDELPKTSNCKIDY